MSSLRNLLCAAAAVGLIFSSSTAEARFGKRSSSSSSDEKREKKKSKTHEATAVGDEDSGGDAKASSSSSRSSISRSRGSSGAGTFFAILDVISTVGAAVAVSNTSSVSYSQTSTVQVSAPPPVQVQAQTQAVQVSTSTRTVSSAPLLFRVGADGASLGGGTGVGLFMTIDGDRMGVDARGTGMTLPTDDGTSGTDSISLGGVHLTYAMISRERIRLRLEGGLSMVSAPDISMAGPSVALSLEACLVGALDLELRAQGTAFPYQQLDTQAGLAVNLSHLVLRGGWRGLYLNDSGRVDGVEHEDVFSGPYVGLGFSF